MFQQNSISYRSPAKIIISGEHSVVYGKKAISAAINLFTTTTINQLQEAIVRIQYDQGSVLEISIDEIYKNENDQKLLKEFKLALQIFMNYTKLEITFGLNIVIKTDVPESSGLGSSASFVTSFVQALYHYITKQPMDINQLVLIARDIENIYHGSTGSGLDVFTVSYGGVLQYDKKQGVNKFDTNLFKNYNIILIDTGEKKIGGTAKAVKQVADKINSLINGMDIINYIGDVSESIIESLIDKNNKVFQELIIKNQKLLDQLTIVTPAARQIVDICESVNIPCKITGAGNGGYCIAFLTEEQIDIQNTLLVQLKQYNCKVAKICEQGCHKV